MAPAAERLLLRASLMRRKPRLQSEHGEEEKGVESAQYGVCNLDEGGCHGSGLGVVALNEQGAEEEEEGNEEADRAAFVKGFRSDRHGELRRLLMAKSKINEGQVQERKRDGNHHHAARVRIKAAGHCIMIRSIRGLLRKIRTRPLGKPRG
jgi:hypothetical protein